MNKSIVLFFAIFLSNSLFSQETFTLKIKVQKSPSKLVRIFNQDKTISDTIKLNIFNSKKYTNSVSTRDVLYVQPLENDVPIILHLKGGDNIKVKTKLPKIQENLVIKGSEESVVANEFLLKMSHFKNEIAKNEEKLYEDETADGQYYYDSIIQSITATSKSFLADYISKNQGKQSLLTVLGFVDFENDYNLLLGLESGLKDNYAETPGYRQVKKAIFKYEMFQKKVNSVGEEAPILILPGVDGEDLSMEELKGYYILIDFWASWCAPCRAEHPRLTRLYEQYHEKGFGVYSISLDKDKEKWIKAIEKDQLIWKYHVSNLKMFDSPAVDIYNVNSLPFNVLVDYEGKVIAFNLRGEKLEKKIKELFDEN